MTNSRSLLAGLALDTTLGELLEVIEGATVERTEQPLYVASPDGGLPVNVDGKVTAEQPGMGRAITKSINKTTPSTLAWELALGPNNSRTGLSITNLDTSASSFYVALVDQLPLDASAPGIVVNLNPGDYWECPAKYVGGVALYWRTASVSVLARLTEYV